MRDRLAKSEDRRRERSGFGVRGGIGDGDGIAVISGSGSAVTGRKNGKIEKAGGSGHILGDGGGGYTLAIEALRQVLRTLRPRSYRDAVCSRRSYER
jgi:N-acetylglucosamine kinase-like BadF-type ATPase